MKKFALLSLVAVLFAATLTSCGGEEVLATPETDKLRLNVEYEGKNFLGAYSPGQPKIGRVTLTTNTDGDTAHFADGIYEDTISIPDAKKFSLRFLGVNTPESTAAVEPWGKKASVYVANKLSNAKEIVAINDPQVFNETDGSGGRQLGFLWYRNTTSDNFRLLNLEIVEQCYSKSTLFKYSSICPYLEAFQAANARAQESKRRVWGEKDPGYDYSDKILEPTIRDIRENYENYGISEEGGGSSGFKLRLTGLVVGMMGNSLVVRDVVNPYDDGTYASIYVYAGYNNPLASQGWVTPGDVIKFVCRASMFNNAMQVTDLNTATKAPGENFDHLIDASVVEATGYVLKSGVTTYDPGEAANDLGLAYDLEPYAMDASAFTDYTDYAPYLGAYVKTRVTIRNVTVGSETYYYKMDENRNITFYANSTGTELSCNLRADGQCAPSWNTGSFQLGHTYEVCAYLNSYFDKYQLQLFNSGNPDQVIDVTNEMPA